MEGTPRRLPLFPPPHRTRSASREKVTSSHVLAVDLGGTNLRVALVDLAAKKILARRDAPTPASEPPEASVEVIATLAAQLEAAADTKDLPMGLATPGLISPEGIVRISPNLPKWRDVDLGRLLAPRRTTVLNDANAFTLGEWAFGAGGRTEAVLGITLGTGVGGGLVLGGKIHTGPRGWAGEIGHAPVIPDGRPCACGGRGCLERYLGRDGIVESAHEAGLDVTSPEALARLAGMGDAVAMEVFSRAARILAGALAQASLLLDLDRIVIGGGIASAGNLLFAPLDEAFCGAIVLPLPTEIRPAKLGGEAGLLGAASAAASIE